MLLNSAIEQAILATPTAASTGYIKLYPKADGKYYTLDALGVERPLCELPNDYIGQLPDAMSNAIAMTPSSLIGFNNGTIDYNIPLSDFVAYIQALGLSGSSGGYTPWYVHDQVVASDTWTIAHNLDCDKWVIQFYDHNSPANQIHPSTVEFTQNTVIATFTEPTEGTARFISTCGMKDYVCSLNPWTVLAPTNSIAVCQSGEDTRFTLAQLASFLSQYQTPYCTSMIAGEPIVAGQVVRLWVEGLTSGLNAYYVPNNRICNFEKICVGKSLYQVFKANQNTIESLELYIKKARVTDDSDVKVELFATTTSIISGSAYVTPTGAPIASTYIDSSTFTTSPSWHEFTFASTISVTSGSHYAIKVSIQGNDCVDVWYVEHVNEVYYDGVGYKYNEANGELIPFADIPFKIFATPPVPEDACGVYLASAAHEVTSHFIGVAANSAAIWDSVCVYTSTALSSWLTCAERYYLSNTPGWVQLVPWTINVLLGLALTPTELLLKVNI